MNREKTVLVLSAGAMFGAWQAGVWRVLAGRLRPNVVVGVSSGALNAWAIAGGCRADELAELWLNPAWADVTRLRLPLPPWSGVFDSGRLEALAEQVHSAFRPKIEIVVAATEVRGLRARLFRNEEITWRHLAASCAIPFGFQPVKIDGRRYVDGGFLGALPLWAASALGATRVIAVHALPKLPSRVGRAFIRGARLLAPLPPSLPPHLQVTTILPSESLGSTRDLCFWKRENIRRWIALGERDAEAFLRLTAEG